MYHERPSAVSTGQWQRIVLVAVAVAAITAVPTLPVRGRW